MHNMYDEKLLQQALALHGLNFYRLSKKANVDPKTAKAIVTTGTGNPDSIFKVAKALGFSVTKEGDEYDFRAIVKRVA